MSVLVKGMKMPESCPCELVGVGYDMYCSFAFGIPARVKQYEECCESRTKPDWCPLLEIKPHGKLIDADALLESIKEARKKDPEIEDVYIDDYFTVAEWVVSAPTIIGAEGKDINVTTKDGGT